MDVTCAIPSGIACRAIRNKRSFPRRRSGSGRVLGVDYCKHEQEAQSDWWGGWEGGLVKERGSKDKRGWKALLITSVILCSQYSPKQQFWSESLQVSSRSSTREAQGNLPWYYSSSGHIMEGRKKGLALWDVFLVRKHMFLWEQRLFWHRPTSRLGVKSALYCRAKAGFSIPWNQSPRIIFQRSIGVQGTD